MCSEGFLFIVIIIIIIIETYTVMFIFCIAEICSISFQSLLYITVLQPACKHAVRGLYFTAAKLAKLAKWKIKHQQ